MLYAYGRKVIHPAWQEKDRKGSQAAWYKGIEGCTEASPQGHVVLFVVLVTGLSQSWGSRVMQVLGLCTSVASVAKTAAEWHLYTDFNKASARQLPPSLPAILKASLCLLPHFLFRSTSLVLLAAFLRLYALIPILSYVLVILIITLSIPRLSDTLLTFPMVLFTPMVDSPVKAANRRLLELSLLAAPLVLLPSLLVLFLLPHLATEDSLLAALPHSLYNSTVPLCPSPTDAGSFCQMPFDYDLFCSIFPALALVGLYCLVEGILILFKHTDGSTSYWTPYRWLDAPWLRDSKAYFDKLDEKAAKERSYLSIYSKYYIQSLEIQGAKERMGI